jgi:hypothetical protein
MNLLVAVQSPLPTIPWSQKGRSLLELSKKLGELANIQVRPQTEDVENVPEV